SVQSGGAFYDVQWATIDPATGHLAPLSPGARPAAPSAPLSVAATPGDASATVRWVPPRDAGGALISRYAVSARPIDLTGQLARVEIEADGNVTSANVTGLQNGTSYTF